MGYVLSHILISWSACVRQTHPPTHPPAAAVRWVAFPIVFSRCVMMCHVMMWQLTDAKNNANASNLLLCCRLSLTLTPCTHTLTRFFVCNRTRTRTFKSYVLCITAVRPLAGTHAITAYRLGVVCLRSGTLLLYDAATDRCLRKTNDNLKKKNWVFPLTTRDREQGTGRPTCSGSCWRRARTCCACRRSSRTRTSSSSSRASARRGTTVCTRPRRGRGPWAR